MQAPSNAGLRTMIARVSPDDIVIYANSALASYLKVSKRSLVGAPLEVLGQRAHGEISSCFARPESGRPSNHLVTDADGRVFEAKLYSEGGVLDIVLDEVTTAESIGRELREATGTPFESLNEEELRTARHPERRYLTVSFTQLRGLSHLTERLAAMEVRLMVNSFVEEAGDAVFETGCTVGETSGDAILGIYGAPRYFADHPLRAIRAACDQMAKAASLHAGLYREGKELPPSTCGIWTGDTLVGTLGNSAWQHYTAIGTPVDLARRLGELARPGEIVLPEHTLTHLLRTMPSDWQHVRAESEFEPDLSDFQWTGDDVAPAPDHLKRIVYLVGPGVQENTNRAEFYFDYLWSFRVAGRDHPVPILRVVRPTQVGDSIEFSSDNVIAGQAVQTLGKYKLIEVVGTGGMGKVWRGVDRFGNAVAIKVLHSSENVTDSQIKRFRREAEIMARLPHRNICRVYEMNEFDGIQYLAMEFVDGLTLSDLLYEKTEAESTGLSSENPDLRALINSLRSGRASRSADPAAESGEAEAPSRPRDSRVLPAEQGLNIVLKVCDAVQFAHEHGVLHRDIKPGNILLREDGEPLVADFGLAKLSNPDATQSLSVSGHVVGTLENMSPEQAESSKDVDERADVYSIGTILYQMLTGRRHFEPTGNIVTDAQTLKHHEPIPPRTLNPLIDADLEIITLKALRTDPAERYRSVAALRSDIEHYRRGEVISARPVSPIEVFKKLVQRNRGVFTAIAASCVIFIFGTLIAIAFLFSQNVRQKQLIAEKEEKEKILEDREAQIERQGEIIRKARADAEAATALAEEKQEIALKAMEDLKDAGVREQLAKRYSDEIAKRAEQSEENLARMIEEQKARPTETDDRPTRQGPGRLFRDAPASYQQANQNYRLSLSPDGLAGLRRFENNPEGLIGSLTGIMDATASALLEKPEFFPAWMLKGRLHLALGEFAQANEAFATAARVGGDAVPTSGPDNPQEMLKLTAELTAGTLDFSGASQLLLDTPHPPNHIAGLCLQILSSGRGPLKDSTSRARPALTAGEAALAIASANGAKVFLKRNDAGGTELVIWGAESLNELSALRGIPLAKFSVVGARTLNWPAILALGAASLDFSKCDIERLPPLREFASVRELGLAGTPISNLEFLRGMPNLVSLDLSNTHVTDLRLLAYCRDLKVLNLDGLNPVNLRTLMNLALEKLTLSPLLISDKTSLNSLRLHRGLRIVRAPGDPTDQPAAVFWQRLYGGAYNQSE